MEDLNKKRQRRDVTLPCYFLQYFFIALLLHRHNRILTRFSHPEFHNGLCFDFYLFPGCRVTVFSGFPVVIERNYIGREELGSHLE